MYHRRKLFDIIKKSTKSALLLGCRQTGKSTLIRALCPDLEINLSDEIVFLQHLKDPALLKEEVKGRNSVFIDEIQRVPSLLNTIQFLIDRGNAPRFLLTGSSARKLRRGKANLLPGRIHTFELGPLCHAELGDRLDVNRALTRGMLPGIYLDGSEEWKKTLRSYSATYLKEEIQAESLTRNLEGFSRFFDVVASGSGNFIDFSKVAALSYVERSSVKRYFEILSDTLIVHSLDPFVAGGKKRLIQHPRYYFFDVGVLNAAVGGFDVSNDRKGNLFEHFMLQQIVSTAKAFDLDYRVSTYRTSHNAEVDFILEIGGEVFAIEVKATKNVGKSDLTGLKSFKDYFGKKHRAIVAYMGETARELDGIVILPWAKALENIFGHAG